MSSSSSWDANTESQDELLINIPLMEMKRANKAAINALGEKWSPSHDKYAARWLFKKGVISDFEREQLFDNIAEKVQRIKKLNPAHGRWRVW